MGAARSVEMGLTAMVAPVVSWFVTEKLEWRSFGTTEGREGQERREGKRGEMEGGEGRERRKEVAGKKGEGDEKERKSEGE